MGCRDCCWRLSRRPRANDCTAPDWGKKKERETHARHVVHNWIPEKPVPTCRRVPDERWTPTARPFDHSRIKYGYGVHAAFIPPTFFFSLSSLAWVALFKVAFGGLLGRYPSGYMQAVFHRFVYNDPTPYIPSHLLTSHAACTYLGIRYRVVIYVPICLPTYLCTGCYVPKYIPISSCLPARPFRACSFEKASSSNTGPP